MQTGEFRDKVVSLSNRLLRYAGCFLTDKEDARDAVQDVLLKLWEKRGDLSGVRNIEAFAMQVTRNHCLDKIRATRTIPLKRDVELRFCDSMSEVRDLTEWKDTSEVIKTLVARLPEQQRNVILLRDIEQLEYEEIAGITGMDLNNLRVNLSRARKQIREELLIIWNHEERRSKHLAAKIF
jgi:RNA polymerase sigma factor (sigma-70 family)